MNSLLLVLALTFSAAAAGQAPADLSGTWQISAVTNQGTQSATLVLTKEGDKYAGAVTSEGATIPAQVAVKDKSITITITTESSSGPRSIVLTGTIDGDAMSGTADNGRGGTAPWTGKRAAAKKADVSGTWAVEVVTDQGTGTPTFILKQDGEKLSGQYKGQFGEAPVTGTIAGSDISFSVDINVQGTSARLTYKGTVEGDTMKGTVTLGEMGTATFKGTRKP